MVFALVAERLSAFYEHGQWLTDAQAATLAAGGYLLVVEGSVSLGDDGVYCCIGGRSSLAQHERLLRFVFPERPGALLKFLSLMQPSWNISLFHYRNQGADYGRILVGMQVPASDDAAFRRFLAELGYPWVEETDNPAYRLFLQR